MNATLFPYIDFGHPKDGCAGQASNELLVYGTEKGLGIRGLLEHCTLR